MPSNKRWCVEVKSPYWWMPRRRFSVRHLFKTRKEAGDFLIKYGGRFRYEYSSIKKVK